MGSILVGSREDIAKARRVRKLFGGALRQAGIVAAAAVYALEHHIDRLRIDHDHAQLFANRIEQVDGIVCDASEIETNLVFFEVDPKLGNASQLSTRLKEKGVLINATGPQRLRACTHLDVTREDALRAAEAISETVHEGFDAAHGAELGPYARG
ncbi:MAG: low specificity L-threonine aldolase, partial [Planctomycetaceae bacterium]